MYCAHSGIHNVARATPDAIAWSTYTAVALHCLSSASSNTHRSGPACSSVNCSGLCPFALPCYCHLARQKPILGCLTLQPTETLLVTEYLEGGDLFQALACESEGKLSWYR